MKRIRLLAGVLSEFERLLRGYLAEQSDIDLLGCVHDGASVVERLQSSDVDVVVVDLVLPNLDALGVLDHLSELDLPQRPQVLVVTPIGNESIVLRLLEAGADYCLLKPFAMDIFGSRVRQLASGRAARQSPQSWGMPGGALAAFPQVCGVIRGGIEGAVAKLITDIGVPISINGYRYLCRAVRLVIDHEPLLGAVTKALYPAVAKDCGSTPSRVERSIRHAVEVVWTQGDQGRLKELFGHSRRKHKPTNAEFIAVLADRLRPTSVGAETSG